ncbi:LysE family translocator [Actinophytocola gossypii]|uniref:LysE family translocator n=1 Tax=Actinophytocola gossypii TaxID=2812003 RepID=A0ABT2J7Y0_9PSEU|nr:LysE family translocator [Actinophytocola gossypii]MCT2583979.1 LysE family translocator [Actinophytocola gossypii]
MPTSAEWLVFLGASALFAILPGPGVLYVLARSLRGGRADGVRSVVGNGIGASLHVLAAALGLSAVLATSATAFTVVKLAGAAYLVYLGVRALLDRNAGEVAVPAARPRRSALRQGVVVEALNPKTALFFLAFLPHFVHRGEVPAAVVFVVLGLIVVAMAMAVDLLVAFFAGALSRLVAAHPRWQVRERIGSGLTMIGLGGALALAER